MHANIVCILIVILITPWFWQLKPVANESPTLNPQTEIIDSRMQTTWARGKVGNDLISRIYINWPMDYLNKKLTIVFENLDIGNYFFAGHPRERVGVVEVQKFFLFQLILFILGISTLEIKKITNPLIIYSIAALVITFIFQLRDFRSTLILAPPIITIMGNGLKKLLFDSSKKLLLMISLLSLLELSAFLIINSQ